MAKIARQPSDLELNKSMRILYVAYSFPPVNIVAAQRALFQARYMAEAGAEVTVICAEQTRKRDDASLLGYLKDVPGLAIHRITPWGREGEQCQKGFKPSAKGWLWVLRCFLLARKLLHKQTFDLVYTTYGPKYPHLAGRLIHDILKLTWVAEYRDPWNGSDHKGIKNTVFSLWFERWLLKPVPLLVTVSHGFQQTLEKVHGKNRRYAVIYNGFDPDAYTRAAQSSSLQPKQVGESLRLILAGTVYPFQHDGLQLLLLSLQGRTDVQFEYYGASTALVQGLIEEAGVQLVATAAGQVPHEVIVGRLLQADAAVLPVSPVFVGQLPVKFYDYLAARKPVLMLNGAGTEIEGLLQQTQSGCNAETVKQVTAWLDVMQAGLEEYTFEGAEFFTRKNQAECLLGLLKDYVA